MLPEGNLTLDSILEGILDEEQSGGVPANANQNAAAAAAAAAVTIKTEPLQSSSSSSSSSPTISSSAGASASVTMSLDDIPCISIKTELPDSCTAAVDDIMVRGAVVCVLQARKRDSEKDTPKHCSRWRWEQKTRHLCTGPVKFSNVLGDANGRQMALIVAPLQPATKLIINQ